MAAKNYAQLEELHRRYVRLGLRVLAFPSPALFFQEYHNSAEIERFLARNEITFPVFKRIKVNGPRAHPLYKFLKLKMNLERPLKRNFVKFLTNRDGAPVRLYDSSILPAEIENEIVACLTESFGN
jgi:glutathione peroxidase